MNQSWLRPNCDPKQLKISQNQLGKRKRRLKTVPIGWKKTGHGKALSSPIATMLLIAIVIIASVLFYAYSVGLLGSLQKPAQHGSEMLVIENVVFTGSACNAVSTDCSAYVTVRNVGSIDSKVGAIYVDSTTKYGPNGAALISVGQVQSFTLPNVTSTQHWFKVATLNGSVFSTYGPQNIFIVALVTGTITYQYTTFTTTYTTIIAYTTTSTPVSSYTTTTSATQTSTSLTSSTTTTMLGTSTTLLGTSTTILGTSTTRLGTSTTMLGTSTTRLGTSTSKYYPYGTSTTWGGTSTTYGGTSTTWDGITTTFGGTSTTYDGTSTTYGGSSTSTSAASTIVTTISGTQLVTTSNTTTMTTSSTTTISSTTSSSIGLAAAVSLILLFLPKVLASERTPARSQHRSRK